MEIVSNKILFNSIKEGLNDLESAGYKVYRSAREMKKELHSATKRKR